MTPEYELFKKFGETHDKKIRDELIDHYTYIAKILAHKFSGCGVEFDDIYQVACMGLVLALDRFDPDRGVQFATFATPTVLGEIRRFLRDKAKCIKIPRRLYDVICKAEEAKKRTGSTSAGELAKILGMPEETIEEAYRAGDSAFIKSLEDEAYTDGGLAVAGMVGHDEEGYTLIEDRDFIKYCMSRLDDREKEIFRLRFYCGRSQTETAEKLGVSQMHISRMERKMVDKLRKLYAN